MRNRTLGLIIMGAFIVIGSGGGSAQSFLGEMTFSGDAGLSIPVSNSADQYGMGFVVGVNGFYPYRDNVHLGMRLAFNRWGADDGGWPAVPGTAPTEVSGASTIMEFVPQVRYLFNLENTQKINIFAQGGPGLYRYAYDVEASQASPPSKTVYEDSTFDLGLCIGGGVAIRQESGRCWEIKPVFNVIFTKGESSTYLSLTAGVTF
ncbi:MAG: hypothetical protein JXB45_10085 [Candidatus Krumholzibacteriota bacterium]|nr:hypothetical protein [Candidatus Krumholzibacteriota bacterium]